MQRCPICRDTVPGQKPKPAPRPKRKTSAGARVNGRPAGAVASRGGAPAAQPDGRAYARRTQEVRVHRVQRAEDDGYRCELVPGLHASEDARRLVREIGFASGRLLTLTAAPPSLYAEARDQGDVEQATWMCFLAAYLSPLQGEQSFVGIRQALLSSWDSGTIPDLEEVPLGPRTSHDAARGGETLIAYRRFAEHAGSQERAFTGEGEWTPQRRFERVFERLALPGFGRMGRYDLLVTLGRLGLYELRADSLHLGSLVPARARTSPIASDPTPSAAKRVFGIGDPLHVERRATALAEAVSVPLEALDLALYNWDPPTPSGERVTLGFPADTNDAHAVERAADALEV